MLAYVTITYLKVFSKIYYTFLPHKIQFIFRILSCLEYDDSSKLEINM